jgi:NAD(P)-dependent dehydrogenase (short-subunit alcohol dehydrogenase family)
MRVLKDRVAVVTGAANGIGHAIALELARAGMHVALADVDEPGLRRTAAEIEALDRRALCVPTDVRQLAAVEALLARTLGELGGCHLAVNNAGVMHAAPLIAAPAAQWQRVVDINLWGVIHGCRVFGAHFAARGEGHIVNTASAAGLFPAPGMSCYSTTKFAVVGLSTQLRWELSLSNVGVTVVCPGVVKTGIGKAAGAGLDPVKVDELVRRSPSPEKLAIKVVRAVQRDRAVVLYGLDAYAAALLRVLPLWLSDWIGKLATRNVLASLAADAPRPPAS